MAWHILKYLLLIYFCPYPCAEQVAFMFVLFAYTKVTVIHRWPVNVAWNQCTDRVTMTSMVHPFLHNGPQSEAWLLRTDTMGNNCQTGTGSVTKVAQPDRAILHLQKKEDKSAGNEYTSHVV